MLFNKDSNDDDEFPSSLTQLSLEIEQSYSLLNLIRKEKIWNHSNYYEAYFNYNQSFSSIHSCCKPFILFSLLEIKFLRYLLCPDSFRLNEIKEDALKIIKLTIELKKKVKKFYLKESLSNTITEKELLSNKDYLLYQYELQQIEIESRFLILLENISSKNYSNTTLATSLYSLYTSYSSLSSNVNEFLEELINEKEKDKERLKRKGSINEEKKKDDISNETLTSISNISSNITSLSSTTNSNLTSNETFLLNLEEMIAKKTKEIRLMNLNRNSKEKLPEEALDATRDLLQLKQLYKELSGRWKSSDGHADSVDVKYLENSLTSSPVTTSSSLSTSSSISSTSPSTFTSLEYNKENENNFNKLEKETERIKKIRKNSTSSSTISRKSSLTSTALSNTTTSTSVSSSSTSLTKKLTLSVPTVNVFISKQNSMVKMFEPTSLPNLRPRNIIKHAEKEIKKKMKDIDIYHDETNNNNNNNFSSVLSQDFILLHQNYSKDLYIKHLLSLRSRLCLIDCLLSFSISLFKKKYSWIFSLINIKPLSNSFLTPPSSSFSNIFSSTDLALYTLYHLHLFEHGYHSYYATLILLNFPEYLLPSTEILTSLFRSSQIFSSYSATSNSPKSSSLSTTLFFQFIEAQSLMLPWCPHNPHWLASIATLRGTSLSRDLYTRIDYYRRALQSESLCEEEEDRLENDEEIIYSSEEIEKDNELCEEFEELKLNNIERKNIEKPLKFRFYFIHIKLSRYFLALGHWTKALNSSLKLPLPLLSSSSSSALSFSTYFFTSFNTSNELILLESLGYLRASLSSFLMNEQFDHQRNYFVTKYSDKIIKRKEDFNEEKVDKKKKQSEFLTHQKNLLMILMENSNDFKDKLSLPSSNSKPSTPTSSTISISTSTSSTSSLLLGLHDVDSFYSPQAVSYSYSLYSRLHYYDQIYYKIKKNREKEKSKKDDKYTNLSYFLTYYCWLLSYELIYLENEEESEKEGEVGGREGNHSSLLLSLQKSALLFSDRILRKKKEEVVTLTSSSSSLHSSLSSSPIKSNYSSPVKSNSPISSFSSPSSSATSSSPLLWLAKLVNALILEDLATQDKSLCLKLVRPEVKLELYCERNLMTGKRSLRMTYKESEMNSSSNSTPQINSPSTSSSFISSDIITNFFTKIFGSEETSQPSTSHSSPLKKQSHKEGDTLDLIIQRCNKIEEIFMDNSSNPSTFSFTSLFSSKKDNKNEKKEKEINTSNAIKTATEQVILFLLIRGIILQNLNQIWEAVVMFKLVDSLKELAPSLKFVGFITNYQLAELSYLYDLSPDSYNISIQYLKKSTVLLRKASEGENFSYVNQYLKKIRNLAYKIQEQA